MQKDVLKYNPLSQTEFKYLLKEIKNKKKKQKKKKNVCCMPMCLDYR